VVVAAKQHDVRETVRESPTGQSIVIVAVEPLEVQADRHGSGGYVGCPPTASLRRPNGIVLGLCRPCVQPATLLRRRVLDNQDVGRRRNSRRGSQAVPARTSRRRAILLIGAGVGSIGGLGLSVAKAAAEPAYSEAVKELVRRAFVAVLGPSPAPAVISPAPTPPPPAPCPPLDLTVSTIGTGRTPCGPNNYIKVDFQGDRPPEGWTYWTFAVAESGVRWYPSFAPRWTGGRTYEAELVTGSEARYWIYVFALDSVAARAVQGYVEARAGKGGVPGDGEWTRGLSLSDLGGCQLQKAKSLVPGPCA
jgi:hypothetical protein